MIEVENARPGQKEPGWREMVAPYRRANHWLSLWQVANSVIPFFVTCYLMYLSLGYSYWLTLALAPLASGFHTRMFIIFHDCGHGSFFKSNKANAIVGTITGIFSFTPYYHWRHLHALHHAAVGNLGKRVEDEILPLTIKKYAQTNGDILTLTVKEYQQLSDWEKLVYKFYRHPLVLFVIMPLFLFLVLHRFAHPGIGKRERYSVLGANLALLLIHAGLIALIGWQSLFLVEMPILFLSASIGVWLFYVQHQFEETYWEKEGKWSFETASLRGSSYYKLPKILQWFTGNIGFHHIHHLSPRIPNYYLEKCHKDNRLFQQTRPINLLLSLKSAFLRLWDDEQQRMVGLAAAKVPVAQKPIQRD